MAPYVLGRSDLNNKSGYNGGNWVIGRTAFARLGSSFVYRFARSSWVLRQLMRSKAASRGEIIDRMLSKPLVVHTEHGPISFLIHSDGARRRAETFLSKEPHSLQWIADMKPNSVFWDVGANIGALSLYAAARGDLQVWAFEPAAVNYYNLTANCEINEFNSRMRCLLLGFGAATEIADLHASQFLPAAAFSFKGKPHKPIAARQSAMIWSIDEFVERFSPPFPNYLKIDVHGLTEQILVGARKTLLRPELRQVQIEAVPDPENPVVKALRGAGFEIVASKKKNSLGSDLIFAR